jgi:hypothetical protein
MILPHWPAAGNLDFRDFGDFRVSRGFSPANMKSPFTRKKAIKYQYIASNNFH